MKKKTLIYTPKSMLFYLGVFFLIVGMIVCLSALIYVKDDPVLAAAIAGVGSLFLFVGLYLLVLWKHPKGIRISAKRRF